jgi:outer membrane protein
MRAAAAAVGAALAVGGAAAAVGGLTAALGGGALAADLPAGQMPPSGVLPPPSTDWTISIGAEGRIEPKFQGAKSYVLVPVPLFDVRRADAPERFHAPRDGIGIGLFDGGNLLIGPVGQLKFPRRERDDTALRGLGDVPWAVELGVFLEYWWVPWLRARAELRQGFNGHHGQVADLMVDAVVPVTGQLTLSGGPRMTLETSRALSPYFSVDAAQAAASGLPVFDAKSGIYSVGAGAQARYKWTPTWATHAFVEYERLTQDAAHSPLVVERGSVNQVTVGAGASWSFNFKQFW